MVGIYKITDLTNGKVYIGSSKNIKKRFILHKSALRRNVGDCVLLQEAYNNHPNIDNFLFEILEELPPSCTKTELFDREDYWMVVYNSRNQNYGYNLSKARQSGEHNPPQSGNLNYNYGKKHSDESKQKMRNAWTEGRRKELSIRNQLRWNSS